MVFGINQFTEAQPRCVRAEIKLKRISHPSQLFYFYFNSAKITQMRTGLDNKENSFCAREPAHRHRDRLAAQQGHGEEERAEGPCQAPGEQKASACPRLH